MLVLFIRNFFEIHYANICKAGKSTSSSPFNRVVTVTPVGYTRALHKKVLTNRAYVYCYVYPLLYPPWEEILYLFFILLEFWKPRIRDIHLMYPRVLHRDTDFYEKCGVPVTAFLRGNV